MEKNQSSLERYIRQKKFLNIMKACSGALILAHTVRIFSDQHKIDDMTQDIKDSTAYTQIIASQSKDALTEYENGEYSYDDYQKALYEIKSSKENIQQANPEKYAEIEDINKEQKLSAASVGVLLSANLVSDLISYSTNPSYKEKYASEDEKEL